MTLDEVRKAGRFAWHKDGLVFADGHVIYLWATRDNRTIVPQFTKAEIQEDEVDLSLYPDGWRHPEGCDCEVCNG